MKTGWLLYDALDYVENGFFAAHMREKAEPLGLSLSVVFSEDADNAFSNPPDFVVSRQRDHRLSVRIEDMGILVFNSARVCELCNDKRNTHRFLAGLPMMKTVFLDQSGGFIPEATSFPLVVKPTFGHGGDRVAFVQNRAELEHALTIIHPDPALVQETASGAGRDLRIYVLFGKIIAAVMRTARSGIISNYKLGGIPAPHTLSAEETALAETVIRRFAQSGAPLSFAGIDLIYHKERPVVNEVEDVVGSRMLYQTGGPDSIGLYIRGIAQRLAHDNSANL